METNRFQEFVGKEIIYCSGSGNEYSATITNIPINPGYKGSCLPTVSLAFRDERGKLIRKSRVLPRQVSTTKRQTWKFKNTEDD